MLKKIIHFIKFNNLTVLILAFIFLLSTGVFAQTETGQAVIGAKQTSIEGIDNALLLEADMDNMDMDYKIEKIEQDDKYYYVTYTFLDLVIINNAWQYQLQEKVRKVSKNLKEDLGIYLAKELGEEYSARIKELKGEQAKEQNKGEEKRLEVVEYDGLIGQTLELASKIFPNYEPIKKQEIPSPSQPSLLTAPRPSNAQEEGASSSGSDNITDIYNNYIQENDPDHDNVFGVIDNCPNDYNPKQLDSDNDGQGDACDATPALTPSPSPAPDAAGEGSTSTKGIINDTENSQIATDTTAEEPDVEIIELPEPVPAETTNETTSTNGQEMPVAGETNNTPEQ